MKLSACIIAKDEEKHIERCLKSIYPLVRQGLAEIILVDTGSMDKTVEIAKKYTNNIYFYKWNNDFAEARNFSISKAKGEYLLIIDADEEIEKEALYKIVELFNNDEYKKFNAFTFKEKNFTDEDLKGFGIFTRVFIFKNSKEFFYTGSIHEQPSIITPCKNLDAFVLHYGYIMNEKVSQKKFIRNSKILKNELEKSPNNLYYRYQLAITYEAHGDLKEAVEEIDFVVNTIKNEEYNKLHLLYYNAAGQIYTSRSLYSKVIEVCNLGLDKQDDFIDLIYSKTKAFYAMENYEQTQKYSEEYLLLIENFKEHHIFHDTKFLFYSLGCKEEVENISLICKYKTNQTNLKEFIKLFNFENANKFTAKILMEYLIDFACKFSFSINIDIDELKSLKKVIDFIFERTFNSKQLEALSKEKSLIIIENYLKLEKMLYRENKILNKKEVAFIKAINEAFNYIEKGNIVEGLGFIKHGVEKNPNMARPMETYIEEIISKEESTKYNNEVNILFNQLKNKIGELIQSGLLKEAEELIKECEKYNIDEELCSMKAVVFIMSNKIEEAENVLSEAIEKYSKSFDLTYNLAYVYEISEKQVLALEYYKKALELSQSEDIKSELINKIKLLK